MAAHKRLVNKEYTMIYIDEKTSAQFITTELAFTAVKQALIAASDNSSQLFPVVKCPYGQDGAAYTLKSGVMEGQQLAGLKVGSYWPGNDQQNLPRHSTFIVLVDETTGRLKAVVEASSVNGYRTAASNAVASSVLAKADASTLAIIGAGHQAYFEAKALCAIRPITRVLVCSRTQASAAKLVKQLVAQGLPAESSDTETACRQADIVVTVSVSQAPLFKAEWIKPGTHISAMGTDEKGKQELPPALFETAALFADLPKQSLTIGEFQHLPGGPEAAAERVGAIGPLLLKPTKDYQNRSTIYDSSGIALQDLCVASALIQQAQKNPAATQTP